MRMLAIIRAITCPNSAFKRCNYVALVPLLKYIKNAYCNYQLNLKFIAQLTYEKL
jgi:hypothetical protein